MLLFSSPCASVSLWLRPKSAQRFALLIVGPGTLILTSFQSQLATDKAHSFDHVLKFLFGRPTRSLAQAAIGGEGESFRGRKLQATSNTIRNVLRGFDVIAFDVYDPHRNIVSLGDL